MRVLGLDHGTARCGLALSDAGGTLASPLKVVERPDSPDGLRQIADAASEHDAELIVVGLPVLPSGDEGAQARAARSFAGRVGQLAGRPVELHDERFTSQLAERSERAGATAEHDALAAAHILQSYLDTQR